MMIEQPKSVPAIANVDTATRAQVVSVKGASLVCQVSVMGVKGSTFEVGAIARIESSKWPVYGVVESVRHGRRLEDLPIIEVGLLGEIAMGSKGPEFVRGISRHPPLSAKVVQADESEEALIYRLGHGTALTIGHHRHAPNVPARLLVDKLLGSHFAILGSTGSGKSCAVTVLLSAIIKACPYAHIVIIDPHNEYAGAFADLCVRLDSSTMTLPYWMMNFEEISAILAPGVDRQAQTERAILKRAIYSAKRNFCRANNGEVPPLTVDSPRPYRLASMIEVIEEEMGALNKPEGLGPYRQLLDRLNLFRSDPRYDFLFASFVTEDNMATILGQLLRVPAQDKPMSVIDISGVPSEIADVIVSFLCRMVFETAMWSARNKVVPVLLMCEEAHRYVPADTNAGFGPSRRSIERIAKEGRKYGIALGLVSQRPADLSATSLSQCGTIMSLRMSNERDQAFIRDTIPDGAAWLVDRLPALATGEAVIVGEATNIPQQALLTRLTPDRMPSCQTPSFSERWSSIEAEEQSDLVATIRRWRGDDLLTPPSSSDLHIEPDSPSREDKARENLKALFR